MTKDRSKGKRGRYFLLIVFILTGCAVIGPELNVPAEFPLPDVTIAMEKPEFWTGMVKNPDEIVMTGGEIGEFNRKGLELEVYLTDIFDYPGTIPGEDIREEIMGLFDWARSSDFIGHDNFPIPPAFFDEIDSEIDIEEIPSSVDIGFGMTVRETNIRAIPTNEMGMEAKGDMEFDYFQMSILSTGTPLLTFTATRDGKWTYVVTPYVSGWVESRDIGLTDSREEILDFLETDDFLVVTGPDVPVYADIYKSRYAGRLRLGSRVPILKWGEDSIEVLIPAREFDGRLGFKQGYIEASAPVHRGYLPYTLRDVIDVAFAMMGERYGWGGMFGFWDCSAFTRDVFSVFGFLLPRNSTSQSKVGLSIGAFDEDTPIDVKLEVLKTAPPGITLLRLPGHVMIYLGEYNGRHYVIHDTWAYRIKGNWGRSYLVGVGRVVVSDLHLGYGGERGSLIERITDIAIMVIGGPKE